MIEPAPAASHPTFVITTAQLTTAILASCCAVWEKAYGGSFIDDCPDPIRWMREEGEALCPALWALGILVIDVPDKGAEDA